jgi:hypothetical protein
MESNILIVAKRHHWWPMVQSRFWTNDEGNVTATRADGSSFLLRPINLGVESELYTRFLEDDSKDTSVEDWFAEVIDAPIRKVIDHILDPKNTVRRKFLGSPQKARVAKELGFRINPYIDYVSIPLDMRESISDYVSALLVRHPVYLAKLVEVHRQSALFKGYAKGKALDNMQMMFEVYRKRISRAAFILTKRVGTAEYCYADGGLVVEEPWRTEFDIPFDMHVPLTPDWALQVLPVPSQLVGDLSEAAIGESTNQGVARQNRIILGGAKRFVFSRQLIPVSFIVKHFGKPAPKIIGYGVIDGQLHTSYQPHRR